MNRGLNDTFPLNTKEDSNCPDKWMKTPLSSRQYRTSWHQEIDAENPLSLNSLEFQVGFLFFAQGSFGVHRFTMADSASESRLKDGSKEKRLTQIPPVDVEIWCGQHKA